MGRKKEKLSCCFLTAYSGVSLGIYAGDLCLSSYLTVYLLDYAKLSPSLVGIILAVAEIVEVIASAIVGQLSDNTKGACGPRRPWILGGSLSASIFILLVFIIPPDTLPEWMRITYYFITVLLTSFSFAVVSIPHQAYGPELTDNYKERLKLSNTRSIFSFVGMLALAVYGFVMFAIIISVLPPELLDWVWVFLAGFPSVTTLIFGVICVIFVRVKNDEDLDFEEDDGKGACSNLYSLMRVPEFILVVIIFAFSGLVQYFSLSMLAVFIVHVLGFELNVFTMSQIVMMAATVITVFVLNGISKLFEKKTLMTFGCVLGSVTYIAIYFLPNEESDFASLRYGIFLLAALLGVTNAIIFTLPNAMMGDVTDLTLLKYRRKQEGLMFSSMEIWQSVLQAAAAYIINFALDQSGYISEGRQPENVQDIIRLMFCAIPTISLLIIWIFSSCYPLNKERHSKILKKLKKLLKGDKLDIFASKKSLTMSKVANLQITNLVHFGVRDEEEKLTLDTKQMLIRRETKAKLNLSRNRQAISHSRPTSKIAMGETLSSSTSERQNLPPKSASKTSTYISDSS